MKRRKKIIRRSISRRSSAVNGVDTTNLISVAGGAIISKLIDQMLGKMEKPLDAKLVAGGKIVLGIVLPMITKDGKTKNLLSGVGSGMIAQGSASLLTELGILKGLGADDSDILLVSLEGIDDVPVVNGMNDISVVSGDVLADDFDSVNVLAGDDDDEDTY